MSTIDEEGSISAAVLVNGTLAPATASTVKAAVGAGNAYTFTKAYSFSWKGQHYSFRPGQTYALAADVKTALLAASAPMTVA